MTTQPPITDAASAMKLVPREPTEAMLSMGAAMCDEPNDAEDRARAFGVWTMMYEAAQIAPAQADPINMILHCPHCHLQHIDEPDERTPDWTNPPHRSHLCHGCGCIWRPADVATNGVSAIETLGKADTWTVETAQADPGVDALSVVGSSVGNCDDGGKRVW